VGRIRASVIIAACGAAALSAGCSIAADPPGAREARGEGIAPELLAARDLAGFLDDRTGPASEALITSRAGFVEEVERQAVVDHRRATLIARDRSHVVTVQAVRFRNEGFGRTLMTPKGDPDPSPPALPGGASGTVGEIEPKYAERATILSKGPLFVRLEVISVGPAAPRSSRTVLQRAARAQFAKLRRHESLPGNAFKTGRLKRRIAAGEIATALLVLLLVSLVTAVRDRTTWQAVRNRLRGRPAVPSHAVDVDGTARAVRRSHLRRGLVRASAALGIVVAVSLLPLGLIESGLLLVAVLFVGDLAARLPWMRRERTRSARRVSLGDLLATAAGGSISLAIGGTGVFVIWFGVMIDVIGLPDVGNGDIQELQNASVALGVALLVGSRVTLEIGRRLTMRRVARRARADSRREVLLLRSFADDRLKLRVRAFRRAGLDRLALRRWERFEELIASCLLQLGPVEAAGEPGEFLPPLGAARTYYAAEDWQREVSERIGRAALVVVSVGRTPAVSWEVGQIGVRGAIAKTVFVIPPVAAPERRARIHLLADLLDTDPAVLDHERPGLHVLAVVAPDSRGPAIITSGTRDDVSYDRALRAAVDLLAGRARVGPPERVAHLVHSPRRPLTAAPGHLVKPRPWYRRPAYAAVAAIVAASPLYGALTTEETADKFAEIVNVPSVSRLLIPIQGTDSVVVLRNVNSGTRLEEVDPERAHARAIATVRGTPTAGSAQGDWIVLTSSRENLLSGVNRRTGRTWSRRLPGAPQGVAVGGATALVALTEGDAVAEVRVTDGRVLRRTPTGPAPFGVLHADRPLVTLAGEDRVVRLGARSRDFAVRSPRELHRTSAGPWAVSADSGALVPLVRRVGGLETGEFLPLFATCNQYVASASRETGVITVLNARTGRTIRRFRSPFDVQSIAVTNNGRIVVAFTEYRDLGVYNLDQPSG
jgi:hypothetical protein